MYLFQRVLRIFHQWVRHKQNANFNLDVETLRSLEFIAEREKRTPEEIASRILGDVMRGHQAQNVSWQRWQSLSPREQEITALICLNYTSRQMAAALEISPATIKTHVERLLKKFDVPDRQSLRLLLNDWDFSSWNRE